MRLIQGKGLQGRDTTALFSLALPGGSSFLLIRVAAPEMGPFVLMAARVLIATAALHIPASTATVLNATTSLFTAVVSVFWPGEMLSARKVAGLLLGLIGVAVVVGWTPLSIEPGSMPSGRVLIALLLLAVLATALASYSFFGLVARIGPTKTLSVLFFVPVFRIIFGHLFLNEPIGVSILGGLGVILVGVFLVMDVRFRLPAAG